LTGGMTDTGWENGLGAANEAVLGLEPLMPGTGRRAGKSHKSSGGHKAAKH
jgi:hypothetical protein